MHSQFYYKDVTNSETPFRILGKGANLLIDDCGVDGVVVKLDHDCFKSCSFLEEELCSCHS